jgi:hypothetical protein
MAWGDKEFVVDYIWLTSGQPLKRAKTEDPHRMRHIKMACGLAATACAVCVAAVPALGASVESNFIANIPHKTISPEKPAKTSGKTEEAQTFKFGNVTIICQQFNYPEKYQTGNTALTTGKVEEESSKTIEVGIHFEKCGRIVTANPEPSHDQFVAANFKGKITIIYHVNGFGEILGNGEGEEEEFAKATVKETAATFVSATQKLCKVIIPEQTVPLKAIKHPEEEFSAASFSNVFTPTARKGFVNNEKESLVITNNFKSLEYKFAEETQCGEDESKTIGTTGVYKGTLNLEIPSGNLGFEEA